MKNKKKKKNNSKMDFRSLRDQEFQMNEEQYDQNELKRNLRNMIEEEFELNYKSNLVHYTTKILLDEREMSELERKLNKKALEKIDNKYDLSNNEQKILDDIDYQEVCRSVKNMKKIASTKAEEIISAVLDDYIIEEIDKICKANLSYRMLNNEEEMEEISKEVVNQFCDDMKNDIIMEQEYEFKSDLLADYIDYKVYDILEYLKERLENKQEELEENLSDSMKEYKEKIESLEEKKSDLERELNYIKSDNMQNHEIEQELFSVEKELDLLYEHIMRFEESCYDETQIGKIEELEERISEIEGWMEEL